MAPCGVNPATSVEEQHERDQNRPLPQLQQRRCPVPRRFAGLRNAARRDFRGAGGADRQPWRCHARNPDQRRRSDRVLRRRPTCPPQEEPPMTQANPTFTRQLGEKMPDLLAIVAPARPPAQEAAVEMTDFMRAFDRLSAARQETIMMVGWDGMSYDDAASRLGVPTGTVRSRLSRAREELRDALRG